MRAQEQLARLIASQFGLAPALICAIIEQESGWNPYAWNPEPHYRYLWNVRSNQPFRKLTDAERADERPPADFPTLAGDRDQEWWAQQASWGLMQVMGAVARERGLHEPYLTILCDAEINITYGCKHFKALLIEAAGNESAALLRWNGGGNPNYPAEVLARVQNYSEVSA